MRREWFLAAGSVGAALLVFALPVRAEDPPKDAPKPPDTPLPKYENPLSDCQVGETCLYVVKDAQGGRARYFEERILARGAEWALVETIWTDETGAKRFQVDSDNTGWRKIPADFPSDMGKGTKWLKDLQKDEVLIVGPENSPKAVRCTHRVIEEPVIPSLPDGEKRKRHIWYSHDIAATGKAKMSPAQAGGERRALSWNKKIPAEECAKMADKYPSYDEASKPEPAAMDEPAMGDPAGMDDPSMG